MQCPDENIGYIKKNTQMSKAKIKEAVANESTVTDLAFKSTQSSSQTLCLSLGAWETKVSNREKKQQRRKDKGPDDSGSPGGVETPSYHTNPPTVTVPLHTNRKNKGKISVRLVPRSVFLLPCFQLAPL